MDDRTDEAKGSGGRASIKEEREKARKPLSNERTHTVGWYPSVYSMRGSRCIQKGNARNSARREQYRRSTEGATRQRAFVFHAKQVDIAVDVSPGRSLPAAGPNVTSAISIARYLFHRYPLPICSMVKQLSVSIYELVSRGN